MCILRGLKAVLGRGYLGPTSPSLRAGIISGRKGVGEWNPLLFPGDRSSRGKGDGSFLCCSCRGLGEVVGPLWMFPHFLLSFKGLLSFESLRVTGVEGI